MDPEELDSLADLTDEDVALLEACLAVEAWALRRECLFAQHLLLYDMFGHEQLCEALDRDDLPAVHVVAMDALGLLDVEPDPDEEQ